MRAQILNNIKNNKPHSIPMPTIPDFGNEANLKSFILEAINGGAFVQEIPNRTHFLENIKNSFPKARSIYVDHSNDLNHLNTAKWETNLPKSIYPLDLAIIEGEFGVMENAAIWVSTDKLPFRVIPFIAEHLIILLDKTQIVADMHQAYEKLDSDKTAFGVFIAGPSKTADIEQTLVIGAQGAKRLTVILY